MAQGNTESLLTPVRMHTQASESPIPTQGSRQNCPQESVHPHNTKGTPPIPPKECTAMVTPLVELTAPLASSRYRLTNQGGAMHRITKEVEYMHRIANQSGALHSLTKGVE